MREMFPTAATPAKPELWLNMECGEHRRFQARMDAGPVAKAVILTAVRKSRRLTRSAGLPTNSCRNRKPPTSIFRHTRMSTDENRKSPATLIVGLIVLAIGLGLVWINAYDIYRGAASKSWPSVKGTVQSSKVKRIDRAGKPDRFETNIRYTYQVDGRTYSSSRIKFGERMSTRMEVEPVVAKYPRGTEVDVFYKPGAPEEAVLETVMSLNVFALLFSPLILLFGLYLLRSGFKHWRGSS
jgi:hypothetical protein